MTPANFKIVGIVGLAIAAICLFVAWERYEDNAGKVRVANQFMQNAPFGGMLGGMMGGAQMEPGIPTATKYALFFAVVGGVGGAICLAMGKSQPAAPLQNVPTQPNDPNSFG